MCRNNIDNVQYNGEFEIKFGLAFRCSERIVECMNDESPCTENMFDSDLESDNDVSDVKDNSNLNNDDSFVVIFNENSEKVKKTMHDDTDNTISDNIEDEKDENTFERRNMTPRMYILSVVYEAHYSKTDVIILKEWLKNKKNSIVDNQEYEIYLEK